MKLLKISTYIFLIVNLILNLIFIPNLLSNNESDKWIFTYGVFISIYFIILATFFVIIGIYLCKRLDEFFSDYYIENGYKIKIAIVGLIFPLYLRGFYGLYNAINASEIVDNPEDKDKGKDKASLTFRITQFVIYYVFPCIF